MSVRFYFDYISPYAHVAWARIQEIADRRAITLEPVPVLFAAILNACGQKGPAEIPSKRLYTFKDAYRKAHQAGLPPLVPPPSHPFNPLLALRVTSVSMPPADQRRLITAMFRAAWAGGGGIETEEKVRAVLRSCGLDADALITGADTPEVKAWVRQQTESALAENAFGVPTMVVKGELFWGVDSLDALELFLEGRDPFPPAALSTWRDLPASANRVRS